MSVTTHDGHQPVPGSGHVAFERGHGAEHGHADHSHTPANFFVRWFCSTNHKDIGTMYIILAIVAGITGGSLSMIMRAQLLHPGSHIVPNGQVWNAIVTSTG